MIEREAGLMLDRRREESLARLAAHAESEEDRLVSAAFAGDASRETVDAALAALRRHRSATEQALRNGRLEADAAALLVP